VPAASADARRRNRNGVRAASDGVPAVPDVVGPDLSAAAGSSSGRAGADDLAVHDLPAVLGLPGDVHSERLLKT